MHRFRCVNAVCRRSTFAAPLDELAVRSAQRTRGQELAVQNVGLALGGNTVQISTDGLPPLRYTEQRGSEYRRGEGCGDAGGWALVVARPVPSSIHLALYLNGTGPGGPSRSTTGAALGVAGSQPLDPAAGGPTSSTAVACGSAGGGRG